MEFQASKIRPLLPLLVIAGLTAFATNSSAGTKITFNPEKRDQPAATNEDKPAFHRKLWEGSFDRAGDQAGSVANQLEGGLEFDCENQFGGHAKQDNIAARAPNWPALQECQRREAASRGYARQARSIQKQQKVMSVVSKVSDAAAITAVGGVIYSELGMKKQDQADTYESAAKIQRMAGQASYVTGAADLTLGAYAFVAQKRKLEEMQKTLNGKGASTDNAQLNSSLANAVEATKKAAYSHMMYGAGKMAAGYASMHLAKRSAQQAENMKTIQELQDLIAIEQMRRANGIPPTVSMTMPAGGGGPAPYMVTNQPTFTFPTSGSSGLAEVPTTTNYAIPSGGASIAMQGMRNPASALSAKDSGLSGGGGGGGASAGDSSGASAPSEGEVNEAKAKTQKDTLDSFATSLSGGLRGFSGSSSGEAAKDEVPNLAAMMNMGQDAAPVATGLSPTQMYSTALEGTEGMEQGSMSGVNGKSETSLFAITKEKLNKMFQVGNIGIPKELEVKN